MLGCGAPTPGPESGAGPSGYLASRAPSLYMYTYIYIYIYIYIHT